MTVGRPSFGMGAQGKRCCAGALALLAALCAPVSAAPVSAAPVSDRVAHGEAPAAAGGRAQPAAPSWSDRTTPVRPFFDARLHGSFRVRMTAWGRAFLYSRRDPEGFASAVLPPVNRNGRSTQVGTALPPSVRDDAWMFAGNLRLRLEPSMHVGDGFHVYAQLDVLDNLVLGSTPAYAPDDPAHPLVFFSESQAPPDGARIGVHDAVRLKRLWATWSLLHLLYFEAGRVPEHVGLGVLHHGGDCEDCDYGDSADRLSFALGPFALSDRLRRFYVRFAWDFPGEGPVRLPGHFVGPALDVFGQPYDGSQVDDVDQYVFELGSPLGPPSRGAAVGFGWYNAYRKQSAAADWPQTPVGCPAPGSALPAEVPLDCVVLLPRGAKMWLTSLWVQARWSLPRGATWYLDAEAAGVLFGRVDQLQGIDFPRSAKELWAGGGVVRTGWRRADAEYGLELGAASGDPQARHFGVADGSNLVVPDAEYDTSKGETLRRDRTFTQFVFNRDYHVDLLLFRRVLGAVTNALYARASARVPLWRRRGWGLTLRGALLYAAAMFPEATPGRGRSYGVEADAGLRLQWGATFGAVLEAGVLKPLDALDAPSRRYDAHMPWTVRARLHLGW